MRSLGRAYIEFGLSHPNEYRVTFMDGPGLIKDPAEAESIGAQVFLIFRDNLQRLADAELLEGDVTVATHTVWFGLHGLVSLFIARPMYLKVDRDTLIEALLEGLGGVQIGSPPL
jgi:hypothetical protein